ncbi:hypothetical protein ACFV2D_36900 [Streptomyces capillispiralis]|uniref:hypothetical protein n=1 Tax=Streptomyces capillispiralis TaxID=68182 RepID=UPI00369620CF
MNSRDIAGEPLEAYKAWVQAKVEFSFGKFIYSFDANAPEWRPYYRTYLPESIRNRDRRGLQIGLAEIWDQWMREGVNQGEQVALLREKKDGIIEALAEYTNEDVAEKIWSASLDGIDPEEDLRLLALNVACLEALHSGFFGATKERMALATYEAQQEELLFPVIWDPEVAARGADAVDEARQIFQYLHFKMSGMTKEDYFKRRLGPFRMEAAWGVGEEGASCRDFIHRDGILPDLSLPPDTTYKLCNNLTMTMPENDLAHAIITAKFQLLPEEERRVVREWHAADSCPWKGLWDPIQAAEQSVSRAQREKLVNEQLTRVNAALLHSYNHTRTQAFNSAKPPSTGGLVHTAKSFLRR